MYTDIKIRFKAYQNNGKNDPNTIEKHVLNELKLFCQDVAQINQCMIDVCRYFKVARLLPRNHAFFQGKWNFHFFSFTIFFLLLLTMHYKLKEA